MKNSYITVLAIYLALMTIVAATSILEVTLLIAVSYGYLLLVILRKEGCWSSDKMIATALGWCVLIVLSSLVVGTIPAHLIGIVYTFYFSHQSS